MAGVYARALYAFQTSEPGEIGLEVCDVVQILHQVDANWLCGRLDNRTGNFPSSFVQTLDLPQIQPGEKVFVALKSFQAEVQGDLGFQKGKYNKNVLAES